MTMFSLQHFLTTHQPNKDCFFTIAIDGRGASGKSALAEYLKRQLPDFTILNGDDYFEPVKNKVEWGDFNNERFAHDVIDPLKQGNSFMYRPYSWHTEPHLTEKQITIDQGFCLERCFSFQCDLDWDLKIWVETPKEICLTRGLAREKMPRERALATWRDVWQPAEDAYIQSFDPMDKADLILDGTKPFEEQISIG